MQEKPLLKFVIALTIILALCGTTYYLLDKKAGLSGHNPSTAADQAIGLIDKQAPDFSLPMKSGRQFVLKDNLGKGVILNFWATWCPPCIEEMPDLVKLAEQLKPQGIRVVAIAIDQDWKSVDEFLQNVPQLRETEKHLTLLLDPKADVAGLYYSSRYPETFMIRNDGVIDSKFVGAQPWLHESFKKYFDRLDTRK